MRDAVKLKVIASITFILGLTISALQIYLLAATQRHPTFAPDSDTALFSGGTSITLSFVTAILLVTSFRVLFLVLPIPRSERFARYSKWLTFMQKYGVHDDSKKRLPLIPVISTIFNVLAICVTFALVLNTTFLTWMVDKPAHGDTSNVEFSIKCAIGAGLGLEILYISCLVVTVWWPTIMFTGCVIAIVSTLQYLTTIATILFNFSAHFAGETPEQIKHNQIFVCLSLFLACPGFVGFALIITVSAHNRLSSQTTRLAHFYTLTCLISICLCITWLGISIRALTAHDTTTSGAPVAIERCNVVLSSFGIVCSIICICCTASLRATPRTKLQVQEYDLLKLNEHELNSWATLIDAFSANNSADVAKGKEALDLMIAYVSSPMPGFQCKVLRVYDNRIADIEKQAIRSYDEIRAWETLDEISMFNKHNDDAVSIATTLVSSNAPSEKLLSKNAIKKAQKKAQKKSKTKSIAVPDFNEKSPEQIEREQQFRVELLSTEGLILLTTIDNYDLTGPVKGRFGRLLQRTLGSKSWFKPMCVRFGILGTHWPFRQMVFYTAPTKKPTARTAALLASVSSWNDSLPRSQRCSLIYNPCYGSMHNERALGISGWTSTHGAPSHVIDLRPHKGLSLTEYLKAIKYRNQAAAFKSAHGEVIETGEFTPENCAIAMELWANIAEKRTSEGHTAVLKDPNAEFLESLGKGSNGYRKLLFLKVDGEVIASCVLFFLGSTLTSDMQGLDHEKARQYKAYFVMMQETITIALREGISFVDFGPTTAKPKLDIGCSEIPLLGGIKAKKPLATIIGLFADQIDV